MRIWYIPPAYLDNQRLRAAHQEVHAFLTCIKKGVEWGQVTRKHKTHLKYSQQVHDATVLEAYLRKNLHLVLTDSLQEEVLSQHYESPKTAYLLPSNYLEESYQPPIEDLIKDTQDLREKWRAEGYFFGTGRLDLRTLEEELGIEVGETPEQGMEIQKQTKALIAGQKVWFDSYRKLKPKSRLRDRLAAYRDRSNPELEATQ